MNDLDTRLRDAGARLREGAPTTDATEQALAALGDVRLDDDGTRRNWRWVVAPAVLVAAAAAIIGVVVVTRPDETAVVPADTTVAPTIPPSDLDFGVDLAISDADFDGDGGACLTLSTPTDSAAGCVDGPTMRASYGHSLSLRLDGAGYLFDPPGVAGTGEPARLRASDPVIDACIDDAEVQGSLVEVAGCDSTGAGIVGVLPRSPGGSVTWTAGGTEGVALDLLAASADIGARVFRSPAASASQPCVIVVARGNSVRDACGIPGTSVHLAGSSDAPLVVTADSGTGTATIDRLDAGATLGVNECAELTAGELVALLPEHGTAGSLLCGGDLGAVWVPPTTADRRLPETSWDVLQRDAGGTWSVAAAGVEYTCTDGIAAQACAAMNAFDFGQAPTFPSVASIAGFDEAVGDAEPLPGRAAEGEFLAVAPAADLPALAEAVVAAMRAEAGDPDQQFEVFSDGSPLVVRRTNLDDAVTATIFVLNTADTGTGVVVVANGTRAIDLCGRGTTTADGALLCV